MHLYTSDGLHAWFHLHGTSRPARSASEATKYKMKKILVHSVTPNSGFQSIFCYRNKRENFGTKSCVGWRQNSGFLRFRYSQIILLIFPQTYKTKTRCLQILFHLHKKSCKFIMFTSSVTNALSIREGTPGNTYTFFTTTSGNLFFTPVFLLTPYTSRADLGIWNVENRLHRLHAQNLVHVPTYTVGPDSLKTFPGTCKGNFLCLQMILFEFLIVYSIVWIVSHGKHFIHMTQPGACDWPAACFPRPISYTMTYITIQQVNNCK